MLYQVLLAELFLLPQYVSQKRTISCDMTMSPMCNSQLSLYLEMFLTKNISTHQAGNEERKEGGKGGKNK
jgi:hypothetical protein